MSGDPITVLVAGADLLASACPEDSRIAGVVRRPEEPAAEMASRVVARGASRAVVLEGTGDELSALADAGVEASAWPSGAPPVSDRFYADGDPTPGAPRVFFAGPVNADRDRLLNPVKHRFDLLHLVGGADSETLAELMGRCSIAIDLRPAPGLEDADRIGPALAAGMLVISEDPVSRPGLTPGKDVLSFSGPVELEELVERVLDDPTEFDEIRRSGRRAAEQWRASAVLPV